jgi:hypothetical protein
MAHTFINTNSVLLYDSGTVAAGAALSSGVLDLSKIETLFVVIFNGDAAGRTLQSTIFLEDGTTQIQAATTIRAVAAGPSTTELLGIGPNVVATGITAVVGYAVLPTRLQLSITAAGTSNCRMTIYGR